MEGTEPKGDDKMTGEREDEESLSSGAPKGKSGNREIGLEKD